MSYKELRNLNSKQLNQLAKLYKIHPCGVCDPYEDKDLIYLLRKKLSRKNTLSDSARFLSKRRSSRRSSPRRRSSRRRSPRRRTKKIRSNRKKKGSLHIGDLEIDKTKVIIYDHNGNIIDRGIVVAKNPMFNNFIQIRRLDKNGIELKEDGQTDLFRSYSLNTYHCGNFKDDPQTDSD